MGEDGPTAGSVRLATAADAPVMARLRARSWQATYADLLPNAVIEDVVGSEAEWAARLASRIGDPDSTIFVIEIHGTVVGVAITGPSGDPGAGPETGEVRAIYLDPDAIGRGLGRTLFAEVVADLATRGFTTATLWVLDTNARARRFYEIAGWAADGATKTAERPGGALHEVRYRRELTGPTPPR